MAAPVRIWEWRTSLIWTESLPDAFFGRSAGLGRWLSDPEAYCARFASIQQGDRDPDDLRLPWPPERSDAQRFWHFYLEKRSLGGISARSAWRSIVPFREKLDGSFTTALDGSFLVEAFYYPHAVSLVITATCDRDIGVEEWVVQSREVRRGPFQMGAGQDSVANASLAQCAESILDHLRARHGSPAGQRTVDPFSVTTVIRGANALSRAAPKDGSLTHRALAGVARSSGSWKTDDLPRLGDEIVKPQRKRAPAGHLTYGSTRGRVVWFPAHFTATDKSRHTLGCYHRNLVFASLQTESLGTLAIATVGELGANSTPAALPVHWRACAERAAGLLGRLHGGDDSLYQSASVRTQIEENFKQATTQLRQHFDMSGLSA